MYQKRVGISAKETSKNQRIYRRMHCKLRDPAFLSTRRTLPGSQVRIVSPQQLPSEPQKDWIETVQTEEDSLQAAEEDSSASDSIDSLTAKAMLHAAQLEASEKSDLMRNSQCRGEIGRLRSAAQNLSFRSPNRSILDESDDFPTTKMATTMSKSLRGDRVLNESEHLDDQGSRNLRGSVLSYQEGVQASLWWAKTRKYIHIL